MLRCRACSADLADGSRFCQICGAAVPPGDAETMTATAGGDREGRFRAGVVVAGRYRIIGLVGRGGMGEVYRAHDQKLDQAVALKFLPEALGRDGGAIARFHNEVRTAREVTHPNVCRVHDIGETDGVPFISMEFIDGEDLAGLLRRIGRLPQDKGIEVAHALCAGLMAAHRRGVLHRDLKPANIMVNRAGQVLITDFGLAGIAERFRGADLASGTPAYMAPEQLQRREVTARSDIYALGLVLYEIFTGRRPFSGTSRGAVAPPSSLVGELDPAIDRVILACLAEDPAKRPASAFRVARALPGGNPVAGALAVGQTPSPEMVAASGGTVGLSVRATVICLVVALALLIPAALFTVRSKDLATAPADLPPEVLAAKARDIAAAAGYRTRPEDHAYGFVRDTARVAYLQSQRFDWRRLGALKPSHLAFWYREAPDWLVPRGSQPGVTPDDPPPLRPGMIEVWLDARGDALLSFRAVPAAIGFEEARSEVDWRPLFEAAALDMERFTSGAASEIANGAAVPPEDRSSTSRTWIGPSGGTPDVQVRVEATAFHGRPVSFVALYPWSGATARAATPRVGAMPYRFPLFVIIYWVALAGGCVLARHNYRRGRADRRGALVLGAVAFWLTLASWLLQDHYTPTVEALGRLTLALGLSLFAAAFAFVMYAAIEPYARRYWPSSLVSWARLVSGRLRDPLVGQDVLIGALTGIVSWSVLQTYSLVGLAGRPGGLAAPTPALTLGGMLAQATENAYFALWTGVGGLLCILLLKVILRRERLAAVAFVLILGATWWPALGDVRPVAAAAVMAAAFAPWVWTLRRFGMVAGSVATFVNLSGGYVLAVSPSLWYAPQTLLGVLIVVALAVYGFHTALAGRPLFGRSFLQED